MLTLAVVGWNSVTSTRCVSAVPKARTRCMIVCRKKIIGCPVRLTPIATPRIAHMLKRAPDRHSRARKKETTGMANRNHEQCMYVAAVINMEIYGWMSLVR